MDKKYLINHFIYLLTTVLSVLLIGYVVFHLSGSGESNLSTAVAKRLHAGQTISEMGYIFKDETLLFSESAGGLYSALSEGEKVGAGKTVAGIFKDPEGILESVAAYDRAIALLEKANDRQSVEKTDLLLRDLTADLRRCFLEGESAEALRKTEQLQVLLNIRKTATGTKDNYSDEIAQLKSAKGELLSRLGAAEEHIVAPFAGNYYESFDGYEPFFTAKAAKDLTIDGFSALREKATPQKDEHIAGKLRTSSTWYLALMTENGSAMQMTVGESYTLTFSGKGSFEMTLQKLQTDKDSGKGLLVFKSDLVPDAGLLSRCEQVSLQVSMGTGLMVPPAAVRYLPPQEGSDIPDSTGVYVKEGNKLLFRRIRILCQSDGYYVVKEFSENDKQGAAYLKLNDVIVTSGKDLEEGYRT